MGDNQTIYLIDGSSYIHRAFHAIRNLANSSGLPTNAAYGFTRMLLKLMEDKKPEYLAVAFDARGPNFRHEIYEAYKANRPPMHEDLAVQIPYIKRIVQGLNLEIFEMEGFEADDLIGTLARKAEQEGFQVVVVTGDKDFRQIISPRVSLWDSMRDRDTTYESFKEATGGLEPEQVVDLMGLSGDASDNVPGVPGVGEKTALKLIQEFRSMEGIYRNLEGVKQKKLKENLENFRENAFLSRRLVTIDCDVPLDAGIERLKVREPDPGLLSEVFRELEFRELWDQFSAQTATEDRLHVKTLMDAAAVEGLARELKEIGRFSLDTETTSENPFTARLVGLSFSWNPGEAFYIPLCHEYLGAPRQVSWDKARETLKGVLEDPSVAKIGQNIKYDSIVLKRHGVDLRGLEFDTMVASYVINPGFKQHNLDFLAQQYLNHKTITYHEVVGKGRNQILFSQVPIERAAEYSGEDAEVTLRLSRVLGERLETDENMDLFRNLEMKLIPVLIQMELNGFLVDTKVLSDMSRRIHEDLKQIEKDIYKEAGMEFNINSPQQLGFVLFEKLGLPSQGKTSKTSAFATDVRVLKKLCAFPHRIPELLLTYRTLSKLKSTYLDTLVKMVQPETGRIHTSFNQTVAATGRLSSSNPNLQNIPIRTREGRAIRKGFVAAPGCVLLSADYSQIELRVFAHYSGDAAMKDAFAGDQDVHARTAAEIFDTPENEVSPDMRRVAKAINFGIIYGMGPQKLSTELAIDLKTARDYIERYYETHEGVKRFREQMIETAQTQGYVTTLFNRRRYLPDINHRNRVVRAEAERMAVNTPIQGTAADLIKHAMIRIHERLGEEKRETKMLLQVHDELVFEVPKAEVEDVRQLVREEMENVHELDVPLKVDMGVGADWAEAH